MAAEVHFDEDTGEATGSPAKGTTTTQDVTDCNWKNSGVQGTAYTAAPITAGNNSFDKWQFVRFTGSYNQILNGKFAHTAGTLGTGLTLMGPPACTGDGDRLLYTTPSASANANLTTNMTTAIDVNSGVSVCFGATGPHATGKAASTTANPAYSNYLTTQLLTTVSAAAGDSSVVTLSIVFDEN